LKTVVDSNVNAIKTQWGQAFDKNLAVSRKVVTEFSKEIPELSELVKDPALGSNPALLKFLAKVGETLWKEDAFKGGDPAASNAYTPADAKRAINTIMGNKEHPYWNKSHPGHRDAVKEVQELMGYTMPKV
jgi:hypothetical protein